MKRLLQFAWAFAIVTALSLGPLTRAAAARTHTAQSSATPDQTPLTPNQMHQLLARVIANQHRDDATLDTFERIERHVERDGGPNGPITSDKTYRVVPTGSGNLKLLIEENGQRVPPDEYQRELREWARVLDVAVHPNDPREVAALAKQQKKFEARTRLIDAIPAAYRITWLGREVRDGRIVEKLHLDPNPDYQPRGNSADWLVHARVTAWIDLRAGQLVRASAHIIRDISIGGGILGKVYRGGHFVMQEAPAAPGIWEPTLYQYDLSGRKFLFTFQLHEVTSLSHYRLLGTPDKALVVARDDLAYCRAIATGDPQGGP